MAPSFSRPVLTTDPCLTILKRLERWVTTSCQVPKENTAPHQDATCGGSLLWNGGDQGETA